jgi:hypothetical protein
MMDMEIMNAGAVHALERDIRDLALELARYGRFRSALERIRDEVIRPEIDRQFAVGGDPAWEPIEAETARRRSRNKMKSTFEGGRDASGTMVRSFTVYSGDPLVDTGQMERLAMGKARFHIKENSMTYGRWPQTRWFAPLHNMGQGGMPLRPWTNLTKTMQDDIIDITWDWYESRVNKHVKLRYA